MTHAPPLFLLVLFSISPHFRAEEASAHFRQYSLDQGLSQNSATSIVQDARGFLWVGTLDGLNRFDGYRFKTFLADPEDPGALSANYIRCLLVDSLGRLWLGTQTGGLIFFDAEKETFTQISLKGKGNTRRSNTNVYALIQDRGGVVWAGIESGICSVEDFHTSATYLFPQANSDTKEFTTTLWEDRDGRLWVGTYSQGLLGFDRGTKTFFPSPKDGPLSILALYEDRQGRFWVGTRTQGLQTFDPQRQIFKRWDLPAVRVNAILEDREGTLWIGTHDKGLYCIDPDGKTRHFQHHQGLPSSLTDDQILSLCQDRSGHIWIGTDNGGVNQYRKTPFQHYRHNPNSRDSLSHNLVWAIHEDREGFLWVGTTNGLNRMDQARGKTDHYHHEPNNPNSLSSNKVRAIHEDRQGFLWLGTHGAGLNRFDPTRKHITRYPATPDDPKGLSHPVVTVLLEDRLGVIWVGTEGGLNRYHEEGFQRFGVHPIQFRSGLTDFRVTTLHEDRAGKFWIGTFGTGLYLMDRHSGQFKPVPLDRQARGWRGGDAITSICETEENGQTTLWLGTYGGGLYRMNAETETIRNYTRKDGLPNEIVYGVLVDGGQRLWMSTNQGLARFDPRTETFRAYGPEEGIQSNEFNRAAYFKSARGELFFGGLNGFNAFRPEQVRNDPFPPRMALTDFLLFNKSLSLSDDAHPSPLEKVIGATERLTLSHRDSMITFEFAALHYADPQKNQYAYMLEGHDEHWIETGADNRRATYTALDPGAYTFRVKGSNKDGVWSEQEARVRLFIQPPPWATWWAKTLYAALLALALAIYLRSSQKKLARERQISLQEREMARQAKMMAEKDRQLAEQAKASEQKLRQFNRDLDLKVVERTQELMQAHGQVEKQKRKLETQTRELTRLDELKTRFFTNISHELRTPLTLILGPLENMSEREGSDKERTQREMMVRNARRLQELINQLLDISKLEEGKMTLHTRTQDLVAFLRARVASFASLAESRNLHLGFQTEAPSIPVRFDPEKMEKIIYNLLSNAFKFTREHGKISVSVQVEESNWVHIGVRDTGKGIPREQLPFLFDRFYQGQSSSSGFSASSGLGLALSRELVELHGGSIGVRSEEGFGSEFILRFPTRTGQAAEPSPTPGAIPIDVAPRNVQEQGPAPEPELHDDRPTIVIIEDNADMRQHLEDSLKEAYRILLAANGPEGIEIVWQNKPDLVIIDIMMPGMDGFEVCQKLKQDDCGFPIPTLLLTARTSSEAKTLGWKAGADAYLCKPFVLGELLALIANLIATRKNLAQRFQTRTFFNPAEMDVPPADRVFLERAKALLEEFSADPAFGVFELAEELGLSRRQLLRRLNDLLGYGPADFIREFRLKRAAQLLEKKTGNISEIAYAVGFKNAAHFTARFRESFGVPPSDYSAHALALQSSTDQDGPSQSS